MHSYYASNQERRIDRMLGFLACKLGVMVHGDIRQDQLAFRLQNFDILIKPRNDAYDACARAGILDPGTVGPLKEIRSWNPLLASPKTLN